MTTAVYLRQITSRDVDHVDGSEGWQTKAYQTVYLGCFQGSTVSQISSTQGKVLQCHFPNLDRTTDQLCTLTLGWTSRGSCFSFLLLDSTVIH